MKFEGNQCSKCGSTLRYTGNRKCVRCEQAYNQTAERKTYNKTYNQKPERKAANARSKQSPRTKATIKAHFESLRGRSVYLWTHARQRASVKGLPFTITKQTVYDRLVSLNGIAEVTFCTLDLKTRYDVQKNPYAPSLDQRIPGRGYTPENFQIVTDWYNRFKNDLCDDEATGILDQYALNKQFRAA